jgi:hypothetical protein
MAYLALKIYAPNYSVNDMNVKVEGGDATKPQEVINELSKLLDGIKAGAIEASVAFATSPADISIGAAGSGGVSGTANLL